MFISIYLSMVTTNINFFLVCYCFVIFISICVYAKRHNILYCTYFIELSSIVWNHGKIKFSLNKNLFMIFTDFGYSGMEICIVQRGFLSVRALTELGRKKGKYCLIYLNLRSFKGKSIIINTRNDPKITLQSG